MKHTPPMLPGEGFIRFRQIRLFIPVARSTWEKGVREGRFPPGYRVGPGIIAWLVRDIRITLSQIERGEEPHWPPSELSSVA